MERDGRLDWAALGASAFGPRQGADGDQAGRPGLEARVTGGYAGGPGQHLDYDHDPGHAAPNTNSDLAFRGVLRRRVDGCLARNDQGRPGRPADRPFQESATCCFPPRRTPTRSPAWRSLADDVRCTHAAAIAQIDKEQLFYLNLAPAA